MTRRHDLSGLMKFVERGEWGEAFEEVLADHFGTVLDTFDLEYDDMLDLLGEHWAQTLWGCAFEDFLTRSVAPDGRNVVEAYLERRGRKDDPRDKAYILALRSSFMSLYEVSDVVPEESFRARDLVRGGEPVLVHERSATRSLKPWDRIAARLVPLGERIVMSGGMLPFSREAALALLEGLTGALDETGPRGKRGSTPPDADMLRRAAPLFVTAWLLDVLPRMLGETSAILNRDGEEPVFHQFHYPLAKGIRQADVAARLDTIGTLSRVRARTWDWLEDEAGKIVARKDAGTVLDTVAPDGRTILGHVELKGRFLVLTTGSVSRAERASAMLDEALGEHLLPPTKRIETLDDLMARDGPDPDASESAPEEIAASLIHGLLDKQYRRTLDEPVPMLGNLTPRAAAARADSRHKVADWLKHLENRTARATDPNDPMATYDFAWIWTELGLDDLKR